MLPILDEATMKLQGEAALATVRARLLHGKPPCFSEYFVDKWQMLTRLSWAAADRVVRSPNSYEELALAAAMQLVDHLRSRASAVKHADRWLARHDGMLCSIAHQVAEHVDHALGFPLGIVVDVDIDRRGRLTQHRRALRREVPEELRPVLGKRIPRALVPDERVTERALDAIAATLKPDELRADESFG